MIFNLSEEFVREALDDNDKLKEKSKEISCDLVQQKYDICQFLEKLGFALTSEDAEKRSQGIRLFSETLSNLPSDYLSEVQLKFIINFFCDRIKDHHSVLPSVLDGINALQKMPIPDGCATKLFHNLFQFVSCQSQNREDREKIFQIIKEASDTHYEELKTMGTDFVYGVISAIDGERDPRNLDFLFSFMPVFLKKYPLQHLSEEMFEIFACYFPIDFQPIKSETSISRIGLATKLADCLVASCDFVDWTVSLIVEKLDSDLKVAKCDSLDLLAKSAKNFPAKLIESHFEKMWNALQTVIFPEIDDTDVLYSGLNSLEQILKNISIDEDVSKHIQTTILATILPHLSDAHHKLFKPASSIALVCVKGDPLFASDKTLNCLLLKIESEECDTEQLLKILKVIVDIVQICDERKVLEKINSDLRERLQEIPMKYLSAENSEVECVKVILSYISQIFEILTEERRHAVYIYFQKILTNDNNHLDLRKPFIRICKYYPEELYDKCLKTILENFNSFSTLTKEKILSDITVLIESEYFKSIILSFFIGSIFEPSNSETQAIALKSLKSFLEREARGEFIDELHYTYNFLEKLIIVTRNGSFPYPVLEDISEILSFIVKSINKFEQKAILDKHLPNLNLNLGSDLYLANGILGYIQQDINIDLHYERLLSDLITLSVDNEDKTLRHVSHHLLCTLINRSNDGERNEHVLREIVNKLEVEINANNGNAVEVLAWICKALIVRGYPRINNNIALLFQLLDHPQFSDSAVLAFEIISDDALRIHLPVVKALFKQKLFNIVLTQLDKKLESFSQPHVNAFVYVLKTTPQQIIKINIDKVSPILFKCLESNNVVSSGISLEVLKRFLSAEDEFFHPHISHLITHFLRLTTFQDSMKLRILALECLESLAKYPTYLLLPHKMDVILGLALPVDDKKRLVRRVAVTVRNIWFLIGSSNI